MKNFKQKTINSLAVIFMAIFFFSCSSESGPIVGSWHEYDETTDEHIIMTFDKNNYVHMDTNGEVVGGKNYSAVESGVETFISLTYEVDYTKEPHWIDLIMHFRDIKPAKGADKFTSEQNEMVQGFLKQKKDGLRAVGIFEFIEDGNLKMQLNMDPWNFQDNNFAIRPEYFNPDLYSIMERIKD